MSQLEMESATLSFSETLFNMRVDNNKLGAQLDESVDIIQAEFMSPLTTASIVPKHKCFEDDLIFVVRSR